MKKYFIILIICIISVLFAFNACGGLANGDNDFDAITISMGNDRAAVKPDADILNQLTYDIQLKGPAGTIGHSLGKGESMAVFSLAPGRWDITVKAKGIYTRDPYSDEGWTKQP